MATNQFLPFGTGGGAYVLSPAAYSALAARSSGFPVGLLPKENLNTPLRQASFVAAALSQWAVNVGGQNTNDDGVIANWIAAFQAAFNTNVSSIVNSGFIVYAGNPNTHVAGTAGTPGAFPSVVWDIANNIWWVCATTGNAAAAVWVEVGAVPQWPFWCGTSTGASGNAQSVAAPVALTGIAAGTAISYQVGVSNTGASTITVTGLGTFAIRKESPTGPAPLTGGEMVAGNLMALRYDGTYMQLLNSALGTASLANASSQTGVVAAVSGVVVAGNVAAFSDTTGTLVDSGSTVTSLRGAADATLYQLGYSF